VSNSPILSGIRHLFRAKHWERAAEMIATVEPAADSYVEAQVLRARCLLSAAQFRAAAAAANDAARFSQERDGAMVLRLIAACAEMIARPSVEHRGAVRELAAAIPATACPLWRAYARMIDARRIAVEVTLQARSLHGLDEVRKFLRGAAELFNEAERPEEARDELAMLVEIIEQGPPPRSEEAAQLWGEAKEKARAVGDGIAVARASLALANIGLEGVLRTGDTTAIPGALSAFQEAAKLFLAVDFAGGDAPVQAVLGRTLLRYGADGGVQLLSAAAELWESVGDAGAANGAWRDLYLWHDQRGEAEAAEAMHERILKGRMIESDLTGPTDALSYANQAYVQAELATARTTADAAMRDAVTPGQEASLLLHQASALLGSGATLEAVQLAEKAVAALRPADPCVMLGDALFHLGMARGTAKDIRQLWEEAAQKDEACGLPVAAATRMMNLAQFLRQPQSDGSAAGSAEEAEELYKRAEKLLSDGRDIESVVARGNLAQRRGQTAVLQKDFPACGHWFTEAERLFRASGRTADLAFTLAQQGLVLFQVAGDQRNLNLWREAQKRFDEARELFTRHGLRTEEVRMLYLSGAAALDGGWLLAGEEREACQRLSEARLDEAARLLERMRGGRREAELLAAQRSREDFAKAQQRIYDLGFRLHLRILNQPARALLWLERMKARALLDAMAETHGTLEAPPNADPELAAKEKRLEGEREQLAAAATTSPRRWLHVNRELEKVWEAMAGRPETSAYAALRQGHPVGWEDFQRALRQESGRPEARGRRVVVAHFAWPFASDPMQRIEIIVSRADWEQPRTATIDASPRDLLNFAESCFSSPGSSRSTLRSFLKDAGGDDQWQEHFASLLAPLAEWTAPGDIIGLIPNGPLHALPLHALHLEGIPLAERNAVFYAPSAAVLLYCMERERGHVPANRGERAPAAIFGCSLPAGSFPALPRAVEEARFVARQPWLLPGEGPILDKEVTRANLVRLLPDAAVVHFVGHGVEATTGWESGIVLAGGDRMTALDFVKMRLGADLVVLSGCRTARNRWSQGDEALGLTPALLYAGASSVLASQWEAKERPTELLMERFYELVYGTGRMCKAEALRLAVRDVRSAYPSLADWATFVLQGDWK
jgi:CHAT domain